jgi:dephospho-CoA kinase
MNRNRTWPALLLLAGTSEAGKSSAGQHLSECGAERIKIRSVLLELVSGTEAVHEGVATREDFDRDEFLDSLIRMVSDSTKELVVIESFIDADLACWVQSRWTSECGIVFITADIDMRVSRHAAATNLTIADSKRIIERKDSRKRVVEQVTAWRQVANHWIENNGPISDLYLTLEHIMTSTLRSDAERSTK